MATRVEALVTALSKTISMVGASDRSWLPDFAPVEVEAPVATLSETASLVGVSGQSWPSESAPVEVMNSAAALTETAPLVAGGPLVPSADVSVKITDDVPLFLAGASRCPEELEQSCLVETGEVASTLRALLPSLCPRVFPWLRSFS